MLSQESDNKLKSSFHKEISSSIDTGFFPEKDISDDKLLRDDYEKLRINYELQRDIGSEINIDIVLNRILDRSFEFLSYDRGMILLINKMGKLKFRAYRSLRHEKKMSASSTLIRYVLKKRKGVISSDIPYDERFNKADSLLIMGIRSSIAVPILHQEEILGIILIESSQKVSAFSEKDLRLMMNIANQAAQFIKNSLLHEELRISFECAIRTLSATVDARHPLTAGHSERVAEFSVLIAKELGLDQNVIESLRLAALLHDIGKIGIRDEILLKKGPFKPDERAEMNIHPLKTKSILEKFHFPKILNRIPQIAALHHERMDGLGYPEGISGEKLPIEAKIMAVADVFDALTSLRDYPKYDKNGQTLNYERMSLFEAISILEDESGTHFDPKVVAAFKRCLPFALLRLRGNHFESKDVHDYIKSRAPRLIPQLNRIKKGKN